MESIQIITVASYTYGNALLSTAEVYNMKLLDLPQHWRVVLSGVSRQF